jgi:antitoxin component YwqK of YwqJK toxin-antitoxin module
MIFACGQKPRIVEEYSDGKISQRYYVVNDSIKQGELQKFDPNGKVMEISFYKNGQLSGARKLFFPNGSIEVFENYIDGVIHGDYKVYYETGKIKLVSNYNNGVLEGIAKKYYQSGTLMEEVNFVNNQENGEFVEYHENGNKKWEGNYLNGDNEFGLLLKYNEAGELVRKMTCDSLAICRTFWTIEEESNQ